MASTYNVEEKPEIYHYLKQYLKQIIPIDESNNIIITKDQLT